MSVQIAGNCAHRIGAAAEGIDFKAELFEILLILFQKRCFSACECYDQRRHQVLTDGLFVVKSFHEHFVFYLFMRSMLVDQDHFIMIHGDPVRVKDLTDKPVFVHRLAAKDFFIK